jgi:shikimate dehydrogenase
MKLALFHAIEAQTRLTRCALLEGLQMLQGLNGRTRLFPIIGDPIIHVESPKRLTQGFEARGSNGICIPMDVPKDALDDVMRGLTSTGNVDGLLITMPHKFTASTHCATLSDRARLLGAVSVMRRNADGNWHGDMLDGLAFVKAQKDHGAITEDARVLLLGAGAAGSAIAIAMLESGVRELHIYDPDQARTDTLLALLGQDGDTRASAGSADPTGFDLVCNGTPMGMYDTDPLPISADLLTSDMFVGDVIAGHGVTPFIRAAQDAGCKVANGGQMVEAVQQIMLDFMLLPD